ncbi:MAG TPA: hypothetical protein VLG38_00615, partial [Gammaproteobacteria bacterium]|nr:hypothetical protein [Gammaproteobacteria bacterium]
LALQTSIAGSSFATLCCYVAEKHSSTFAAAALAAAGLTIMYNAHRVNKGSIGAAVSTQIFKSSMSLR